MRHDIFIANGFLHVTPSQGKGAPAQLPLLATVLANMAYYGFAPSKQALAAISALSGAELESFWASVEGPCKEISGDSRRMGDFVVYQNFPAEVLSMSQAEYWFNQILMYLGLPNEWFTQDSEPRKPLSEKLVLKVLDLAPADASERIYAQLVAARARWTGPQRQHAVALARELQMSEIRLEHFGFKENGVLAIAAVLDLPGNVHIADATDVLRLAAAMSDADVSLRTDVEFKRFRRDERRFLTLSLEVCKHLDEDFGARPMLFKKLLSRLHPGDFKAPRVSAAYDRLYKGETKRFNAQVEALVFAKDASVLTLLAERPGEFARRLHKLCELFGQQAADAFAPLADKLTTSQLLKLRGYVATISHRTSLIHPPRGNWSKAQFVPNEKAKLNQEIRTTVLSAIDAVLRERLSRALPQGVDVAEDVKLVKLQTNDQELAPYGRGTVFPIPENVKFVRSATYWAAQDSGNVWFDNGWTFHGKDWESKGVLCWDHTQYPGAAFSGDPTSSKDVEGRACQLIDLYLDELQATGVRYAVWNVLAFSNKKFSQVEDVCAALQWGEDAQAGQLFEPARAQMVFPLRGDSLTKYVAYLDLHERKLVYLDANLEGNVSSAAENRELVAEQMPAFLEYLASLPSVADLFTQAPVGATPVLYTDEGVDLVEGEPAYVFQRRNAANTLQLLDLTALLNAA